MGMPLTLRFQQCSRSYSYHIISGDAYPVAHLKNTRHQHQLVTTAAQQEHKQIAKINFIEHG
jgi:hypothetical protein